MRCLGSGRGNLWVEWQFTLWAEDEDVEAAVQRLAEVRVRGIQRRAAVAGGVGAVAQRCVSL
jgi:hypothetical protein